MITSQTVLPGLQENFLLLVATNNVDRVNAKYKKEVLVESESGEQQLDS